VFSIADAAGPPGQPVVDKVTSNSVTLAWQKPNDDGGGKIKGYVVEVKAKGGEWIEATPLPVTETLCTIPSLKEGQEYQFRVKAVNDAGLGTASVACNPVVAEKPKGL